MLFRSGGQWVCFDTAFNPQNYILRTKEGKDEWLEAADLSPRFAETKEEAAKAGDPAAAQLVAAECVTIAELKDHFNWELIGQCAKAMSGAEGKALKGAHAEVEDQEDEHFYHSRGWARELWMEALGMKAVLPPPEEKKHVKTAIGAARAEQSRTKMR